MAAPNLKSRTVIEILDAAFKLYRENFATFLGILAVIYVPLYLIQMVAEGVFLEEMTASMQASTPEQAAVNAGTYVGTFLSFVIVVVLIGMVAQPIANGALTFAIGDRYLDRRTSIGSCYGRVMTLFLRLLGTVLLAGLVQVIAMLPGLFLFVLGAASGSQGGMAGMGCIGVLVTFVLVVLFMVWFLFAPSVCVLENLRAVSSLGRSRQLARGNFWRIVGMGILLFIIMALISIPVNFASNMLLNPEGTNAAGARLVSAIENVVNLLLAPFSVSAIVLLYYDIRIRREAFDLEVLATAMGGGAAPKPGAAPGPEPGNPSEPAP